MVSAYAVVLRTLKTPKSWRLMIFGELRYYSVQSAVYGPFVRNLYAIGIIYIIKNVLANALWRINRIVVPVGILPDVTLKVMKYFPQYFCSSNSGPMAWVW